MLFNAEASTEPAAAETGTGIAAGFVFDWDAGCYAMENGSPAEVTGEEAVKEWLRQVLNTPTGIPLYPDDFGCSASDLMHRKLPRGYALSELSRQIAESAAYCPAIRDVSALTYDGAAIQCTVALNDGTTTQEVVIVEP